MQNKPLSRVLAKWNRSDPLPVIKAHPGPDPRDEERVRERSGVLLYI